MKNRSQCIRITAVILAVLIAGVSLTGCGNKAAEPAYDTSNAVTEEPVPYTELEFENDAEKIKYDFESWNNYLREDGVVLWPVEVPEDNPFQYISAREAIEIAQSGSGVIFFGAGWCRTCRMLVTLLPYAVKHSVDTEDPVGRIFFLDTDVIDETDPDYEELQEKVLIPMADYLSDYQETYTNVTGTESLLTDRYVNMEEPGNLAKFKYLIGFYNDGTLLGAHVGTTERYIDPDTQPDQEDYELFTELFWSHAKQIGKANCKQGC